jgi:flagellar export protein FliJ
MTRSQRLARLASLNEVKKAMASQRLAVSRQRCAAQQQKLDDFRQYRQEYARGLQTPGTTLAAAVLCDTRRFLAQLDRTIDALEAMVSRAERDCAEDSAAWQRAAARATALVEVLERCRQHEARGLELRTQRELDEGPRPALELR